MAIKSKILKNLVLPKEAFEIIEKQTEKYHITVEEFLRSLILLHAKDEYVEVLDDKTSKEVEEALESYRKGKYTVIKNVDKYFDNLLKTNNSK